MFEPIPYRIRIGVTGRRKLFCRAELEAAVCDALQKLIWCCFDGKSARAIEQARRENNPPVRFEVLSALAEGADRLVADVVLRFEGASLFAVLPLTESDYRDTFATQQARDALEPRLTCAQRIYRVRTRDLSADTDDPARQNDLRLTAYEDAGRYIVDHCQVLIALWNGKGKGGRGGTASVVEYALASGRPVIRIWGGEIHVMNPKAKIHVTGLAGLRRFSTTRPDHGRRERRRDDFGSDFFPESEGVAAIPETARQAIADWLLPYYTAASELAGSQQSRFFRLGAIVYTLSAAATACVALTAVGFFSPELGFGSELALLLLIVAGLLFARFAAPSELWLESRFLTERLRCVGFLALCGIEPTPFELLPFMAHAYDPDNWMVHAAAEIDRRKPALCERPGIAAMRPFLLHAWIDDQRRYQEKKEHREHSATEWLEGFGVLLLTTTIAAAVLHLAWGSLPETIRSLDWLHEFLTVLAIVLPAVTAALVGIQVQREHHRLARRSAGFAGQLRRLAYRFEHAESEEQLAGIVREIDEAMLRESQDWLILMRQAEIKAG